LFKERGEGSKSVSVGMYSGLLGWRKPGEKKGRLKEWARRDDVGGGSAKGESGPFFTSGKDFNVRRAWESWGSVLLLIKKAGVWNPILLGSGRGGGRTAH